MEFEIESFDIPTKTKLISSVPIINTELPYHKFFKNFLLSNTPCIIKNVAQNWEASTKWLNSDKTPNLTYLKKKYGSCDVIIYDCNQRYYNSQQTECCKLSTFIEKFWNSASTKLKYLKDWHLKNTFQNDNFYEVPIYFSSDWLNEFLTEKKDDDYRFVYMGQANTWTPFHADVFSSFSWSANICGRKRWILFPAGEENNFRDSLNNLPYDVGDIYTTKKHFELIQGAGDAIFIPSGWYHQVWNLEDTISVNHNWVNGCNIAKMWSAIQQSLDSVKKEINDCKEMDNFLQHCQIVLNATFGMDFFMFYEFLEFIAKKRLLMLRNCKKEVLFHGHVLGTKHAIFDLKSVKLVLENLLIHTDVADLFTSQFTNARKMLIDICEILDSRCSF